MKNLSSLLFLAILLFVSIDMSAQWRDPGMNPWVGATDPEILKSNPRFKISNTGTTGGSIIFNTNTNQLSGVMYQTSTAKIALATGVIPAGTAYRHDLVLDTLGYVGLGTNAPTARLTINNGGLDLNDPTQTKMRFMVGGENAGAMRVGNEYVIRGFDRNLRLATDSARVVIETRDTTRMVVLKNGNVGIGTTSPTSKLEVHGDICITGEYCGLSDMRLKKNILPIQSALKKIEQLNPVSYVFRTNEFPQFNFSPGRHNGLIAQEVESILPDIVGESLIEKEQGQFVASMKHINYLELIPLLIGSIQELKIELNELRSQLDN